MALALLTLWSMLALRDSLPPRWNLSMQRALLDYGIRGQFDTLFQKLLLRIDYFFVSALVGTTALGYYAMASAAAELLLILPNAISLPL
jgi:O-antigen/teichoic acid export membrane protein